MFISIQPQSKTAVYLQIVEQTIAQIQSGNLSPGSSLPSANDLASSLDLNRNTVLQAYRELRDAGWIELRRGRGARVCQQLPIAAHGADVRGTSVRDADSQNTASSSVERLIQQLLDSAAREQIPLPTLHELIDAQHLSHQHHPEEES